MNCLQKYKKIMNYGNFCKAKIFQLYIIYILVIFKLYFCKYTNLFQIKYKLQ